MTFSFPPALALLLVALPLTVWMGWPRTAYRRARAIGSTALRCLLLVLLILALAGAQLTRTSDALTVIFLIDRSDSVGQRQYEAVLARVRATVRQMGDNVSAGVVTFGKTPATVHPISASRTVTSGNPLISSEDTDIAAAVRLALAMFPAGAGKRIVLISDGLQTVGDAEQAAQLAAAAGVEIDIVPLTPPDLPDVRLIAFDAPASVAENQQFDVSLTIESDTETDVRVVILASQNPIPGSEQIRRVRRGLTNLSLTLTADRAGFRDFTAYIEPVGGQDRFIQNNRLSTFTQVVGPARVLLVGTDTETQYLAAALTETGMQVERASAGSLPPIAAGYAQYDAVVLANVPALQLTTGTMQAMQDYVRELGGGLVVVGGPEAYAPGLYFDTPLEEALPVQISLTEQQRQPKLVIAYLIDRSGSMATVTADGQPLIELAKAAINRSIDFLQPRDIAGVTSFDTQAYWVAEFQEVGNAEELRRLVGTLRPSGGTDIAAGLSLVARDIVQQPGDARHIILLSDGIANRRGLIDLMRTLNLEAGVTLTSIAIGEDNELMRDLAEAGRGTYRMASNPQSIPAIFAQETVLASRAYIFEDPFTPALSARSPMLDGIASLPALRGYVGSTGKLAAQVVLRGPAPYEDPILASWQYGLGRAVAFTSDATARWGIDWVTWGDFARFWGQTVRWTMLDSGSDGLETRVTMQDGVARITLDARDPAGGFLNGLNLETLLLRPDRTQETIPLRQIAPGQYEATFIPQTEGAYLLRTTTPDGSITQTAGWVSTYSREYLSANQPSVLPRMAQLTGGTPYTLDDLSPAFERNLPAEGGITPLTPLLLLLAALLLPFDIAARRLLITRSDLARAAAALRRRPAPDSPPSEQLSHLMQARERARRTYTVAPAAPSTRRPPPDAPSPAAPPPAAPKPAAPDAQANIGERLLKRKQQRRGE